MLYKLFLLLSTVRLRLPTDEDRSAVVKLRKSDRWRSQNAIILSMIAKDSCRISFPRYGV